MRTPAASVRGAQAAMLSCALLLAAGCGQSTPLPSQTWNGIEFTLETRPSPPRPGVNEVLVLTRGPDRRPVHDLLLQLRAGDDGAWVQAIQDGNIGVYRRALALGAAPHGVLYLQVHQGAQGGLLSFPLELEGAGGG